MNPDYATQCKTCGLWMDRREGFAGRPRKRCHQCNKAARAVYEQRRRGERRVQWAAFMDRRRQVGDRPYSDRRALWAEFMAWRKGGAT